MTIYLGTVSHGTMRTPDLLNSFADELDRLIAVGTAPKEKADTISTARMYARKYNELVMSQSDSDAAQEYLDGMFDYFNTLAPEGVYFGAHPGDGSDYGFWPSED